MTGIDVLVSTLGGDAAGLFKAQNTVATAAKDAGVKLFVPSEFSTPSENQTQPILAQKDAFKRKLKEIGLPYAAYYTGAFADQLFAPGS